MFSTNVASPTDSNTWSSSRLSPAGPMTPPVSPSKPIPTRPRSGDPMRTPKRPRGLVKQSLSQAEGESSEEALEGGLEEPHFQSPKRLPVDLGETGKPSARLSPKTPLPRSRIGPFCAILRPSESPFGHPKPLSVQFSEGFDFC